MKTSLLIAGAMACFAAGAVTPQIVSGASEAVPLYSAAARAPVYETVTKVKDGDTFEIAANWSPYDLTWSVRVDDIDTPEKGHRAKCQRERDLSAQASALATRLLDESGDRVRLREVAHDKYGGRIDADVILSDGTSLADHLIEAKLAKRYNGDGPKPSWCY